MQLIGCLHKCIFSVLLVFVILFDGVDSTGRIPSGAGIIECNHLIFPISYP